VSQENVEVVRAAFEAFNRGGIRPTLDGQFDPEVVWEMSPSFAIVLGDKSVWRGREEVIVAHEELESTLGHLVTEVFEVIDTGEEVHTGEEVLVGFWSRGTGLESGALAEIRAWYVLRLDDGRITHVRMFDARAEALEAVGLAE